MADLSAATSAEPVATTLGSPLDDAPKETNTSRIECGWFGDESNLPLLGSDCESESSTKPRKLDVERIPEQADLAKGGSGLWSSGLDARACGSTQKPPHTFVQQPKQEADSTDGAPGIWNTGLDARACGSAQKPPHVYVQQLRRQGDADEFATSEASFRFEEGMPVTEVFDSNVSSEWHDEFLPSSTWASGAERTRGELTGESTKEPADFRAALDHLMDVHERELWQLRRKVDTLRACLGKADSGADVRGADDGGVKINDVVMTMPAGAANGRNVQDCGIMFVPHEVTARRCFENDGCGKPHISVVDIDQPALANVALEVAAEVANLNFSTNVSFPAVPGERGRVGSDKQPYESGRSNGMPHPEQGVDGIQGAWAGSADATMITSESQGTAVRTAHERQSCLQAKRAKSLRASAHAKGRTTRTSATGGTPLEKKLEGLDDVLSHLMSVDDTVRKEMASLQKLRSPAEARWKKQMKKMKNTAAQTFGAPKSLASMVEHPAFDAFCAFMIIANSCLIGVSVNYLSAHEDQTFEMELMGHICSFFFALELLLRMMTQGPLYFTSESKMWNMFDLGLVALSIVDFIMSDILESGGTGSVGGGMKTIKMLRIVRVVRVFRFFKELAMLVLMIIDSLKSLMWALLMLLVIIYVFAIVFTQATTEHMKKHRDGSLPSDEHMYIDDLERQFGSLLQSIYTLFKAMLGGVSWEVVSDALLSIGGVWCVLFLFYIAFVMLAVLNIITGVFVEEAMETARTQRDFLVSREMELREKYVKEMRMLFEEMDDDGSGTCTLEEVMEYFTDQRVQSYFTALGLDIADMDRLFGLLDDDGSGQVSCDEFLEGCLRLRGMARSIDVHVLMHETRKLASECDRWFDQANNKFTVLDTKFAESPFTKVDSVGRRNTFTLQVKDSAHKPNGINKKQENPDVEL